MPSASRTTRRCAVPAASSSAPSIQNSYSRSSCGSRLSSAAHALVFGLQLHHGGEERRLRAAQVVAAAAVRNVSVAIDEAGEVFDHVGHEIVTAAGLQAHHGEVGVPVVQLAKAAARHDVAGRERQQRIAAADGPRLTRQRRPQPIHMRAHFLARRGLKFAGRRRPE